MNDVDLTGIDDRPNGKKRVRMMFRGARVSREFATLDDALRFRDGLRARIRDGKAAPVAGMSLRQAAPAFLARRRDLRNYVTDKSRWNEHILPAPFADRALKTVTRRDVLDWLDHLETKRTADRRDPRPLSRQTRKHCLNLLRAFFDWCVDRDVMPANPARGVKVGGEVAPVGDDWYLTPEEQQRLASFGHVERWIALFALGTGLRQGEQWNLRLVDVHVDGDRPHVFVRFGSEGRTPKNKRARVVPLFGLGLEAARAWLKLLPDYAKRNPHGLMFPTPRGARRGKSRVPKHWHAMVEHLGREAHWHMLRHTCASSLVAGWWGRTWTLEEVKSMLGHSSIIVTERYAHLAGSRLHEVAAATSLRWSLDQPAPLDPAGKPLVHRTSKPSVASSNLAGRTETYVGTRDQRRTNEPPPNLYTVVFSENSPYRVSPARTFRVVSGLVTRVA